MSGGGRARGEGGAASAGGGGEGGGGEGGGGEGAEKACMLIGEIALDTTGTLTAVEKVPASTAAVMACKAAVAVSMDGSINVAVTVVVADCRLGNRALRVPPLTLTRIDCRCMPVKLDRRS